MFNMDRITINLVSTTPNKTESVYETTIKDVKYQAANSGHGYDIIPTEYTGCNSYTVTVDGPSTYTVKRHISSSPFSFNTFLIEIVGQMCMITRHYIAKDVTAHYSISKTAGGGRLSCDNNDALSKIYGYRQARLEIDACQAYDAGFFILKLEEMADEDRAKV